MIHCVLSDPDVSNVCVCVCVLVYVGGVCLAFVFVCGACRGGCCRDIGRLQSVSDGGTVCWDLLCCGVSSIGCCMLMM